MNSPIETPKGTCQICGKSYRIPKGILSHHGFRRPGEGYQTSSCYGARDLPLEVSNFLLLNHIEETKKSAEQLELLAAFPVTDYTYSWSFEFNSKKEFKNVLITEENFDQIRSENLNVFLTAGIHSWAHCVKKVQDRRNSKLRQEVQYLAWQIKRYEASVEALANKE